MCFTGAIIYLLTFMCYDVSIVTTQAPCQTGWFGTRCQLQCHCASSCDVTTSQCQGGSKCQHGWFGVACQYQDSASINSATITANVDLSSPNWITDRDDSTCNGDVNLESIVVTWNDTTPFTWLRFAVKVSSDLVNVSVTFKVSATGMTEMACNNQEIFLVDNHTMDVMCNMTVDVMQVIIRGHSVKALCSLYISGGRNVALKQSASQTSTLAMDETLNTKASNAIDGNTDGNVRNNTCTHTAHQDPSPSWNLKFDRPQAVYRFVLYNRYFNDCLDFPCSDRLKHFTLQSVDSNNNKIWSYQDATEVALLVYTVTVPGHHRDLPISGVQITATVKVNTDTNPILTLCEFEAYGECAAGTWGLQCDNQCNSSCNTTCHGETGACPVCFGFSNPQCDAPCKPGTWGLGCSKECSSSCLGKLCNTITGVCDKLCNAYNGLSASSPEMTEDTTAVGVGVGVSIGCLLSASILVAVCCWKRRGRPATQTAATRPHQTQDIKNINVLSPAGDDHEYETVGPMGSSEETGPNAGNKYDYIEIEQKSQISEEENSKGYTPILEHFSNGKIDNKSGYANVDIHKIMD